MLVMKLDSPLTPIQRMTNLINCHLRKTSFRRSSARLNPSTQVGFSGRCTRAMQERRQQHRLPNRFARLCWVMRPGVPVSFLHQAPLHLRHLRPRHQRQLLQHQHHLVTSSCVLMTSVLHQIPGSRRKFAAQSVVSNRQNTSAKTISALLPAVVRTKILARPCAEALFCRIPNTFV